MKFPESAYNITPIDGRYAKEVDELRPIVSEFGLMKNRVLIEAKHLIHLSYPPANVIRKLEDFEKQSLLDLYRNFSLGDYERIKQIEDEIRHDVKAVELFFREKLRDTKVYDLAPLVHIFLTSEDSTNLAYSLMMRDAIFKMYLPRLVQLEDKILSLAERHKAVEMLGRTHGQAALPTTISKELVVFADRLRRRMKQITNADFTGKLNGAVGNWNSFCVAYPEVDWIKYSVKFIKSLGLKPRIITTQILPHDEMSDLLRYIISTNQIIRDFDEHMWRYISDDWILQKPKEREVGSSTMPQKINPIDFENSEGNTKISSAICEVLADELQRSRLQRDLTGSTLQRWYGTAVALGLQAIQRSTKNLDNLVVDEDKLKNALENHPEVLMEAIQTIGRKEGISDIYDRTKKVSRGMKITLAEIRSFVGELALSPEKKDKLLQLTPLEYVGLSMKLEDIGIERCRKGIFDMRERISSYSAYDPTKLPQE